jgi:o-succinylbenzoate---CoA ligase
MLKMGDYLNERINQFTSVDALFSHLSQRYSNQIALESTQSSQSYSYQKLCIEINHRAKKLQYYGIKRGALILMPMPKKDTFEGIIWWLACWKIGAVLVMNNPSLDANTQSQIKKTNRFDHVLTKEILAKLLSDSNESTFFERIVTINVPANGVFTSGSTGTPKLAILSIYQQINSAMSVNRVVKLQPGDCKLLSLPLYHVAGMALVLRTFMAGATVVVSSEININMLSSKKISHVSLVPTQLHRLLIEAASHPKQRVNTLALKAILLGGSHTAPELIKQTKSLFQSKLKFYTSYGMTETASAVSICELKLNKKNMIEAIFSQSLAHAQIMLSGSKEIVVKAKMPEDRLFLGYLVNNQLTSSMDSDGWFHTKDLGCYDRNTQNFKITGRMGNQFICGGESVQAESIEAFLMLHTCIRQAVVVAVVDIEYGQRGFAFIELNEDAVFSQLDILNYCTHLPFYQRPAGVALLSDYSSKTQSLKPNRMALTQAAQLRIKHEST